MVSHCIWNKHRLYKWPLKASTALPSPLGSSHIPLPPHSVSYAPRASCPFLQSPQPFPARIFSHACSLSSSSLLAWSTASHPSTLSLVSPPSPSFEMPLLWSLQSSAKVPATLTTLLKMTTSCLLFHNPSTLHFSPGIYRFPGHHKIYLLNMFIVYFLL